jgi:outer membrane receptor protein involved in Fe transport
LTLTSAPFVAAADDAQVQQGDQGPTEALSGQLQEVVVTAEKRSERLQDVPAAISALSGATLEAMGAKSLQDYARTVPGLTYTDMGDGVDKLSIRGLNASTGSATVGYYIGETPMAGAVNPDLLDLERIEVLRGPQGTLYGSSSIGGTIRLIPNAPNLTQTDGSLEATGMVTEGADGASPGGTTDVVANVPLVQNVAAVRGVAWVRDIGGFLDRTWTNKADNGIAVGPVQGTAGNLPQEHTWGFRTIALFRPTEQFNISAMVFFQNQHFNGFQDITGGASNANDSLVQNLISDTPEPQDFRFTLYSVTAKYNFGRLNLVSSAGYSTQANEDTEETTSLVNLFVGGPPLPTVLTADGESHSFTEETRLATSERIYGFDAVVGAYYSAVTNYTLADWNPPQYNLVEANNDPTNPAYAPSNVLYDNHGGGYERQTAEFGEVTYHFTDALTAIAGVRHYRVSNGSTSAQRGLFFNGNDVWAYDTVSAVSSGSVHKGEISYKITPDDLVYALYSEGFRPGFGNSPPPASCNAPPSALSVKPDSIKNYEVGAKTMWLDKRLTVNATVYRINWTDIQQSSEFQCGFGYTSNFGEAVLKGVELEVGDQLTRRLSAGLSGSYISAKLQQSSPQIPGLATALAGDQIEQVPNWQFALYGQATYPILRNVEGFARLDYQYTGSSWGAYNRLSDGITRDPTYKVQVIRLLNFRAGTRYGQWEFSVGATNLLNQLARQSIDPYAGETVAIPGRPRFVINRPRAFSLNVHYEF